MRVLPFSVLAAAGMTALTPFSVLANPMMFAQTTQTARASQFSVTQSGGITTVSATGQDFFTFLLGGTPFEAPVVANFTSTVSTNQGDSCGPGSCPSSDSFARQGYSGSFQYLVANGSFAGMNLLSGTFNVAYIPVRWSGNQPNRIQGSSGGDDGTRALSHLDGLVMSSAFLNFRDVSLESVLVGLSGLSPNFAVTPIATTFSLPSNSATFLAAGIGTFAADVNPAALGAPEPTTLILMGSALIGLGLLGRKHLSRR